jgi:uncharacterized membrane protein
MTDAESTEESGRSITKLPLTAAFVALVGLGDSVYLTVHHLTAEPVPCSLISGCETVLTSPYAEIVGIPLAAFGALAYFVAFSLAILAAFGNRLMWMAFGAQVMLMAAVTTWLLYLQAFVIGAFCQFCLLSAITTFAMLIIFLVSRLRRFRS